MASSVIKAASGAEATGAITRNGTVDHARPPPKCCYGLGAHEGLNRPTTFRFLDLPSELRLLIYAELFGDRVALNGKSCRYPQILAISKAIREEADCELYGHSTMEIEITATALKTHDFCTRTTFNIGNSTILDATNTFYTGIVSAWSLHQSLPAAVSKIRNISLTINLEADEHSNNLLRRPFSSKQFNQVHHILIAIVAGSHATLRSLDVTFDISNGTTYDVAGTMDEAAIDGILWPLSRLPTSVAVSIHGPSGQLETSNLCHRENSAATEHAFALYRSGRAKVQKVLDVLHDNTLVSKRLAAMLKSVEKTLESKRWRRSDEDLMNDLRFLQAWVMDPKVLGLMDETEREVEKLEEASTSGLEMVNTGRDRLETG